MGRRNEHSREELRAMALRAAGEIVEQEGLRGLTVRKVAARLGYSPGSLYLLFTNLDDLVIHLNADTLGRLRAALQSAVAAEPDPSAALRALAHAYLRFALANRSRWLSMFEHRLAEGERLPAWYERAVAELLDLVREPLARLLPGSRSDRVARTAKALWSAVHGVCVLGVDRRLDVAGHHSAEELLDTLLDAFIAGLSEL